MPGSQNCSLTPVKPQKNPAEAGIKVVANRGEMLKLRSNISQRNSTILDVKNLSAIRMMLIGAMFSGKQHNVCEPILFQIQM